jgi:ATP synthase protein I
MSQDSLMRNVHRTRVPSRVVDPASRNAKRAYNALSASSVGLELGISVGIGLLVGYYLDRWLGTEPWLMLLWLVLGLVAGFRGVFRAVNEADRAAASEEGGPRGNA